MCGLFGRKKDSREKQEESPKRYLSDILVNDPDGEARLGVQDYTLNPSDLLIDIHQFPRNNEPLIKVIGKTGGLSMRSSRSSKDFQIESLGYWGFIVINEDFPLYFMGGNSRDEIKNLELTGKMLEASRDFPITMIGKLKFNLLEGCPYTLVPFVLELGEYISPPRRIT